jgi:hypothetical protein
MFFHYGDRSRAEIPSARVVTKTLPGVENFLFGRCREGGKMWEAPHPLVIIRDDGGDLRLLKHELGDEDGVRIARAAPRKIAAVFAVPGKESAAERRIRFDKENVRRLARSGNDFLHASADD